MASADKELEEQLLEAGNKLVDPPSAVEELLPLLDRVESCLSRVEQSPTKSMQDALAPSLNALIADKLLRHLDDDVKVAVAACISEITRITAPDAPYDDDQMKEVFRLIVSSFENLYDESSRSYTKRTVILDTVAKVRSCVVMLDLECDTLILEMFQHFLNAIREHHPENVFSSMETIMTLVLEESEDISLNLLSPILASVKKDNEKVLPIARKLGERVLEACATKLKPYIGQAVNTSAISLDDYSDVVASICQDISGSLEQNDVIATSEHVEDEIKSVKETPEESAEMVREEAKEVAPPQQDNSVCDRSPKSVMSNGIAQAAEDDTLVDSKSEKKQENADCSVQSKDINLSSGNEEEPNGVDTEKVDNSEQKPGQVTKKKGRKPSSSTKSAEPEGSYPANEKEDEKMIDSESHSKQVPSSPREDDSVEAAGPPENDKEIDAKMSSPKAGDGESDVVASPSPSGSLHGENRMKKLGRPKKKDISAKEVAEEDVSKKSSEGTKDSEAKPTRRSAKKALDRSSDLKKNTVVDSVKKGSGTASDLDAKKHSKKVEESIKGGGGSSSRQTEDKKKRGRGKANSEMNVSKSSVKDEDKGLLSSPKSAIKSIKDDHSEETLKMNLKRKHASGKTNESDTKSYDGTLVGRRVKVWWPADKAFYEGVVDSFDPKQKKHKVNYDDGDEETLLLKKERWEIIEDDADSDGGGGDYTSPDASDDMRPKKKGKTSAGESKKEGNRDTSKSGGAASSKSKGKSMKSSDKSKDRNKADRNSKASKIVSKSEDEVSGKTKNQTLKSGGSKSIDAAQKMTSKSKNIDKDDGVSTPKPSGKSKQETSKTGKSSKAKSTKSGGRSNANGTGKVKANLLKTKDSENDNSEDSTKGVEDTKGKIPISSNAGGSEVKSGKKRRRN